MRGEGSVSEREQGWQAGKGRARVHLAEDGPSWQVVGKAVGFKRRGWGKEAKTNHFVQAKVLSWESCVPLSAFLLPHSGPSEYVIPTCVLTQQERGSQEQPRIFFTGQVWQAGEGCPGCCQAALHLQGPA